MTQTLKTEDVEESEWLVDGPQGKKGHPGGSTELQPPVGDWEHPDLLQLCPTPSYSDALCPGGISVSSAPCNATLNPSGWALKNLLMLQRSPALFLGLFCAGSMQGQGCRPLRVDLPVDFSPQYKMTKYNKRSKCAFSGTLESKELCQAMPSAQIQSSPEHALQRGHSEQTTGLANGKGVTEERFN